MYIKNFCRSIIVIGLTFILMLGVFTDNVMAANEIQEIQELKTLLVKDESTQSTFKSLPSLQLGDGANNGAQDSVLLVQKLLVGLGHLEEDAVTGNFTEKTEKAVKNYQKDKGITQSGKVDITTWSKLGHDHSH
jgi:peptidoglycan hydrolase-like protein with peptidoglycan-binding domain